MGFLLRWGFAFALLAATYNPTKWNYAHWASVGWGDQMSLVVLSGLILFIGYVIYVRATLRSIGVFGMILLIAVAGTLLWVLYDYGVIDLTNPTVNTWLGLLILSLVLAIGLGWSIVRRRLSGQLDVDDYDDNE